MGPPLRMLVFARVVAVVVGQTVAVVAGRITTCVAAFMIGLWMLGSVGRV